MLKYVMSKFTSDFNFSILKNVGTLENSILTLLKKLHVFNLLS